MTKKQAISEFRFQFKGAHKGDPSARYEEWFLYLSNLRHDGLITKEQEETWKYPFHTPSHLR